jgi:pimeloyl-ACP methyl ester carboxylesterase
VDLTGGIWWILRNNFKTPGPDHYNKLPLDRGWLFDFMKFDGRKDGAYISAPTLIISASKDGSIASPKAHYELGKYMTNSTVVVIPGARHVFWKHEPKVADTMVKWLTSS